MTQQATYDDVPVVTGQVLAEREASGFFQPAVQTADGMLASDQARAVAEVQAALVIAASRPRNELRARERLMQACQRASLASGALYQYSRGGSDVSGPSIRLAEAAARSWGNMTYGFREITRSVGASECEAYAWDLETNTKAVRQFTVRHKRDVGGSSKDVKTERDIYEVVANNAQRRVRAAILEIIPGDIVEDAVDQCERTLNAHVGNIQEATGKLLEVFAALGVSREAIEKRLGHRVEAIQPAQVINFRKIYTSIKDGMSEPKDWFEMKTKTDNPKSQPTADPATQSQPKATVDKSKTKSSLTQAAQDISPYPETASTPEPPTSTTPPADPETISCPHKDGGRVLVSKCNSCSDRNNGCPSWNF